jgi:exosortase
MRAFDITVLRDGNVIELFPLNSVTTKKLEVVEACSGIRSLMTLVTLAVVFAYFTRPSGSGGDGGGARSRFAVLRTVLIVVAAVPIAIITNAARVSGTGVLAHYYGTEVADGFFHSFSGWVVYVVAFLLLFGFGWLLDRFDPKQGRGGRGDGGAPEKVSPQSGGAGAAGGVEGAAPSAAMRVGGGGVVSG